jgi:hypothetical protein
MDRGKTICPPTNSHGGIKNYWYQYIPCLVGSGLATVTVVGCAGERALLFTVPAAKLYPVVSDCVVTDPYLLPIGA